MYRNPSISASNGLERSSPEAGTAGRCNPHRSNAETRKERALTPNATLGPTRETRMPPTIGPIITAAWNVVETMALAATMLCSGTTFGSEACRLGRNSAPRAPRRKATAYRCSRDGVPPPTKSDATATIRSRSDAIINCLRGRRSTSGPPRAPISADGPSCNTNSRANERGLPWAAASEVATAIV